MLCSNQILSSVDFDCEPSSDDVPDLQVQHPGHDICIHNLIVVCHDSSSNLEHNYRDDEENGERRHSPHNLIHLGAVPGQITFGISPERACTTLACGRGYSSRGACKMVLLSVRAVSNLRLGLGVPPAGARGASAAAGCCAAQPALCLAQPALPRSLRCGVDFDNLVARVLGEQAHRRDRQVRAESSRAAWGHGVMGHRRMQVP